MRKKVLTILVLCVCLSAGGVFAYSQATKVEGEEEFRDIGIGMRQPVNLLLAEAQTGEINTIGSINGSNEADAMGEVLGIKISKTYFDVRYASYKSSPLDYENPKEAAWDSIKEEVWERKFAEENGLMPTEKEIEAYVETNREGFNSTSEGRILIKALCEGMGLTENEYWEYNKKYQAPIALIHINVEVFLEKNKMEKPNYDNISNVILDNNYFEQLS